MKLNPYQEEEEEVNSRNTAGHKSDTRLGSSHSRPDQYKMMKMFSQTMISFQNYGIDFVFVE